MGQPVVVSDFSQRQSKHTYLEFPDVWDSRKQKSNPRTPKLLTSLSGSPSFSSGKSVVQEPFSLATVTPLKDVQGFVLEWVLKSAQQGDAEAQTAVADYYRDSGSQQDMVEALKWYTKAAQNVF